MVPPPWGVPAILVLGTLLVVLALLADRRSARRARAELERPPVTPIPGLAPASTTPHYVPATAFAQAQPPPLTDGEAVALSRRERRPTLTGGVPDPAFLSLQGPGVLLDAPVLLTSEPLDSPRDLLTVLTAVRRRGGRAVWVAPAFSADVLSTLIANRVAGGLTVLPITVPDAAQRAVVAERTGADPVSASDVAADYLPAARWGHCAAWIADAESSWLETDS